MSNRIVKVDSGPWGSVRVQAYRVGQFWTVESEVNHVRRMPVHNLDREDAVDLTNELFDSLTKELVDQFEEMVSMADAVALAGTVCSQITADEIGRILAYINSVPGYSLKARKLALEREFMHRRSQFVGLQNYTTSSYVFQ